MISLFAINCHYLGDDFDNWSRAGQRILEEPSLIMDARHADQMIWLDTFGDLIGNTDRHFGNFCFYADEARQLALTPTPVYDMLPMVFAPMDANLVERQFAPGPPTALNLHLWHEVANHALKYWSCLCEEDATQRRLPTNFNEMPRHARPIHWRATVKASVRPIREGYFGLIAPAAGQSVSPTRLRFISKNRTGSLPGATWSPTSRHAPSLMIATYRIFIGPAGISHS